MAKIFLLVNYTPDDPSIGITKKIGAQIRALRELGHDVTYTAYIMNGIAIFDNNDQIVLSKSYPIKNRKLISWFRYTLLLRTALSYVEEKKQKYDYCYGRISAPNSCYLKLLGKLKSQGATVIIESLSYFPGVRPKAIKSRYIAFYLRKNRKKLKQYIDKFITEGEVPEFYGVITEKGKIGVAVDELPIHRYNGDKDELHLITVATEREYHGYDRLIKSYIAYKNAGGTIPITIHLVGGLYDSTKKLIQESGYKDNIIAYGRVSGEPLHDLYNRCNLGIGPLGQHRVGGKKDTGLKTKEYFGIGLPYFYAGVEEDLPENYQYVYQVPSDESNLDFELIWAFYKRIRDKETLNTDMRDFANTMFSWRAIMQQALVVPKE